MREDRACNIGPCPKCTDPITGELYDVGEVVSAETCFVHMCDENYEIVSMPVDNPACYSSEPSSSSLSSSSSSAEECQLTTISQALEFMDSDGTVCRSDGDVTLSVCRGSCSSFDSSPITFSYNADSGLHSFKCQCCAGQPGDVTTETVYCDGTPKTVEVMHFSSCGCKECKAGEGDVDLPGGEA